MRSSFAEEVIRYLTMLGCCIALVACDSEVTHSSSHRSPDGKWQALIQNFNIFVRPMPAPGGQGQGQAGNPAQAGFMLSTDGSEGNAYTFNSMRWSPDSRKIAVFRRRPGYERLVHFIESSPGNDERVVGV